jgi:hypothetical protein
MARRDGAAIRRDRIQEIAKKIQSLLHENGEILLSKTLANLQYVTGLSKDKIVEYLRILEDLGQFALDEERDKIKKTSEESEGSRK